MGLQVFWFIVIAFFWTGFFILEGFDMGVGALHMVVGRTDLERRVAINSIGPFWDGNEVWLIVAAAATFAAFPLWYASMFSALYLAMMLVLLALIIRGVSFEYRGKSMSPRWRATWDWTLTIGSLALPFLLGIALGDLLHGLPINKAGNYTGTFLDLFTAYGVWAGVTLLALTLAHGAIYLSLKTTGAVQQRAQRLAGPLAWVAALAVLGFFIWTHVLSNQGVLPNPVQVIAFLLAVGAAWAVRDGVHRVGVHGHQRRHRRHRHIAVRLPVPRRHGVEHQPGLQPDRGQRLFGPLRLDGDDRRGRHIHTVGPGLPGLELLRLPGPDQGAGGRHAPAHRIGRRQCCPRGRRPA